MKGNKIRALPFGNRVLAGWQIGILALLLCLGGWACWSYASQPIYQGRPVAAWLQDLSSSSPVEHRQRAYNAFRLMDRKAVAVLVRILQRRETLIERGYRTFYLKLHLQRVKLMPVPKNCDLPRYNAAIALSLMGTNAAESVPFLAKATRDDSEWARNGGVIALRCVASKSRWEKEAVAALIRATGDSATSCRQQAYLALGSFTNDAQSVIPALIKGLCYPSAESSIQSLEHFGPAAIPALVKATQTERSYFRPAEVALEKVDPLLAGRIKTAKLEGR